MWGWKGARHMAEFSELIKSFDKIRAYMRDFYLYGFKSREEYTYKSARTYDNERRRIQSWLSEYLHWDYSTHGKRVFLSLDSARVPQNPLYAAWKSKSFTRNDIRLHFFLQELLADGAAYTADELSEKISKRYGVDIDPQTVRGKLREYLAQEVLCAERQGRSLRYRLRADGVSSCKGAAALFEAVKFFQGVAPFGFVGSTILDWRHLENDRFWFKHYFMIHTLDDGILYRLLGLIREGRCACIESCSPRHGKTTVMLATPLRILSGTQSGRQYLCVYEHRLHRFHNMRIDYIQQVLPGEHDPNAGRLRERLAANLPACWGVSFGGKNRKEQLYMKLRVDPRREGYVLERLRREGRGGELLALEGDQWLYSINSFDTNEMLPWVKTFTGRILSVEGSNQAIVAKFYRDVDRMYQMYFGEEGA